MGRPPGLGDALDPEKRAIQIASQRSILEDVFAVLAECEEVRFGERTRRMVGALEHLPDALASGHIVAGPTQRQRSKRLGMKEQLIQRYGAAGFRSASLRRVEEVKRALGLTFLGDVRFLSRKTAGAVRR